MIQRRRAPGGVNRDIDHGPGPVGLMPNKTIVGWAVAYVPRTHHDPRQQSGDTERAAYLRAYRARKQAEASARYRAKRRGQAA